MTIAGELTAVPVFGELPVSATLVPVVSSSAQWCTRLSPADEDEDSTCAAVDDDDEDDEEDNNNAAVDDEDDDDEDDDDVSSGLSYSPVGGVNPDVQAASPITTRISSMCPVNSDAVDVPSDPMYIVFCA